MKTEHEKNIEKIRELGEAGDYTGQALEFMRITGATVEARYKGMEAGHFGPGDDARDRWEIRITRGTRAYVFDYGASIKDTEDRLETLAGPGRDATGAHYRLGRRPLPMFGITRAKNWEKIAREWQPVAKIVHGPGAYSVLCALEKYEPEADIDEFASAYGYTKPSEALRVHKAVREAWHEIRALFGDKEMELLQEIN